MTATPSAPPRRRFPPYVLTDRRPRPDASVRRPRWAVQRLGPGTKRQSGDAEIRCRSERGRTDGDLLQKAQEAVRAGDWSAAKERFEAALARGRQARRCSASASRSSGWATPRPRSVTGSGRTPIFAGVASGAGRARRVLPLPRLPHDPRQRGRLPRAGASAPRASSRISAPSELNGWVELARAYVANESGHPQQGEHHAREALAIARAGRRRRPRALYQERARRRSGRDRSRRGGDGPPRRGDGRRRSPARATISTPSS